MESSDRVRDLNDEAVRAIINEDYARAISLLEESRALEESNILYLNLGRAYQKLGKCKQARRALEKVDDVPIVRDPPPDIITRKAAQYLAKLDEQCPADSKEAAGAEAASEKEQPDEQTAEKTPVEAPEAETSAGADGDTSSWRSTLGWVGLGTGAALVGGGVWLHLDAESRRDSIGGLDGAPASVSYREAQDIEQTANTLDTIGLSLAVAGTVAGGLGTYFLLTDGSAESETSRVLVQPNRDGASVTFSTRW